jgi:hypothetical protein
MRRLFAVLVLAMLFGCRYTLPDNRPFCVRYANGERETISAALVSIISKGNSSCLVFDQLTMKDSGRYEYQQFRIDCGASYAEGACPASVATRSR